jgi:hypothetical protein
MTADMFMSPLHATALPAYHWFGARPRLLDLERYQNGWALALILQREGDCCFIPLAWLYELPRSDDNRLPNDWPLETEAVHESALTTILRQWQLEGWEIRGRIEIQFTGTETDPDFWATIHSHLWQAKR